MSTILSNIWQYEVKTVHVTASSILLTPAASKAADMAHLCVPQNQALEV